MVMQFRLLGGLEVRAGRDAEDVVEIGSPKHRVLLAVLLLRAGRPVPVDDLVNAIWPDEQPDHPRRSVQLYVTRLRRRLDGAISTVPGGYQLDVPAEDIDVGRFRLHLQRAAELTDLDAEAHELAEAVAHWGGEPFAGLPSETLHREMAPQLREQWLQALDRLFTVELRRGRHEQIIGELIALTAQYPLRESLWVRLMTALQRSGRRAEAIDVYHTARRHLVSELGVEPGQDMQEAYATVLFGEGRGVAVVPRQLPVEAAAFVGRGAELARLDELLEAHLRPGTPATVGVIAGTPGVGKTALAVHWARRVVDHFPDGQLWVNLQGFSAAQSLPADQALNRFLRALDVQDAQIPLTLDDKVALYRSLVDGRRMLVVLDNAAGAEQVRPLLPGAPGCLVLVTSRSQLSGLVATEGAHPIMLGLLSRPESRQFLVGRLGADRTRDKASATEDIIRACTGLPLALGIVAARAATRPDFGLDVLAAELKDERGTLDAFAVGAPAVEVRAVFSWSYSALSPRSARLFRLLGMHPGPDMGEAAAASLAGLPVRDVRPLLAELSDAHLLFEPDPGRYAWHDLMRTYAIELCRRLDTAGERHEARRRMFDHYLHTAYAGSLLLQAWEPIEPERPRPLVVIESFDDHRAALAWFTTEHLVLLALVRTAAAIGFSQYSQQLAWSIMEYLYRQGHWQDWAPALQTALDTANLDTDYEAQARLHRGLVWAYSRLGRVDAAAAHGRLAHDLARDVGDKVGLANTHRVLAVLAEVRGHITEALEHDFEALELFEAAGDRRGQARTLNSVGWSYARLDDHESALDYCKRALVLVIELDDRQGAAATWDSLGYAHHRLGHHRQAITCHRRAVALFRNLGDRFKEAACLDRLGDAYAASGTPGADREAREAWSEALLIYQQIGLGVTESVRAKLG
jgi:DNA-binding SARP family transcriptional activator/tetratricopeptide (TPR) repeat protein